MKRNTILLHTILVGLVFLFWTCKHTSENTPQPTIPNLPSELVYAPAQLEVLTGQAANSEKPTLKGDTPFTFSMTSLPTHVGITIDNTGVISIASTVPEATYKLSVTVKNAGGSKTFSDIFTIVVKPRPAVIIPPSNLVYSPNTLTVTQNTAMSSVMPTIVGTPTITYSLTATPTTKSITITNTTGVINVASTAAVGTYTITIIATNGVGTSVVFPNAFTVVVTPAPVSTKTTFEADVKAIFAQNGCVSCHGDLSTYSAAKSRVTLILDRIQRQPNQGGFMPQTGNKVPDEQIKSIQKWLSDGLLEK